MELALPEPFAGPVELLAKGIGATPHSCSCRPIEKSKAMLAQKECSLAEVAAAVGFSGQSQFTTTFHRPMGLPPGEWRRSLRE